ncbi:MAG TPA: hypothetical protein VF796_04430 [Humisphaera sp.]
MADDQPTLDYAGPNPKRRRRPRWSLTLTSAVVGGVVGFIVMTATAVVAGLAEVYGPVRVPRGFFTGLVVPFAATVGPGVAGKPQLVTLLLGLGQGPAYGGLVAAGVDRGHGRRTLLAVAAAHSLAAACFLGLWYLGRI